MVDSALVHATQRNADDANSTAASGNCQHSGRPTQKETLWRSIAHVDRTDDFVRRLNSPLTMSKLCTAADLYVSDATFWLLL